MKKIIENKDFTAIEIHKMYDDDSILCDIITEKDGKEEKREQNIGFIKEIWQEFVTFTIEEENSLKGVMNNLKEGINVAIE